MAQRDRAVDAARVTAMFAVVVGHWLVTAAAFVPPDGHWRLTSPLTYLSGGWVASYVLQVIPLFFIVGGFANATAWRRHDRDALAFARRRWRRLTGPTLVLLGLLAVAGVGLVLTGWAGLEQVMPAVLLVLQPLWFLVVYMAVATLAPVAVDADRRFGGAPVVGLLGAATATDLGVQLGSVPAATAQVNIALV